MPETRVFLGARLPSPYYERGLDRMHSRLYRRQCAWCGLEWMTAEVSVETKPPWAGVLSDCCPVHIEHLGKIRGGLSATAILNSQERRAERRIILYCAMLGGYKRRRMCLVPECGRRWTTFEFLSDGTVVRDVTLCCRCGGPGKTVHNTGRVLSRRRWIRQVTRPILEARALAIGAVDPATLEAGLVEVPVEPGALAAKRSEQAVLGAEADGVLRLRAEDSVLSTLDSAGADSALETAEPGVGPGVDDEVEELDGDDGGEDF